MTRLAAGLLVPIRYRMLMAILTAGGTSAFVADRCAVRVLLAPKFHFLLLGALDAPLAHLPVVLDFSFRKVTVLPENDVEAHPEDAEAYKYDSSQQNLH